MHEIVAHNVSGEHRDSVICVIFSPPRHSSPVIRFQLYVDFIISCVFYIYVSLYSVPYIKKKRSVQST